MQFSRLRRGEIIVALSAVVLIVLVFAVPWVSFANPGGGDTTANAWTSFPTLRWLLLVTAALGLLVVYLQAARSAPALPVALDVVLVTLAAVTTLVLLIRLLTGSAVLRPAAGSGWWPPRRSPPAPSCRCARRRAGIRITHPRTSHRDRRAGQIGERH